MNSETAFQETHRSGHYPSYGRERAQRLILRVGAVLSLPVLPTVILPHLTVEKLSWLTGFGQPPKAPLLYYVAAGGSFIYLFFSAMLWVISTDVARYRPLVIFTGIGSMLAGPIYYWIDYQTGMPHWWLLMDALSCAAFGAVLLWAAWDRGSGLACRMK